MIKIQNLHNEKHLHDFSAVATVYQDTIEGDILIPETDGERSKLQSNRARYNPHVLCAECREFNEPNYATDNIVSDGRSIPVCDGCAAEMRATA